jgi:hypothetical protein
MVLENSSFNDSTSASQAVVQSYVDNPHSIPPELLAACLGRLVDIDVNQLDALMEEITRSAGLSNSYARFLIQAFVTTWVREIMHGTVVNSAQIGLHTREARSKVQKQSYVGNLVGAVTGKNILTQTKILEEAELVAAETALAREELKRIHFDAAQTQLQIDKALRETTENAMQTQHAAQAKALEIVENASKSANGIRNEIQVSVDKAEQRLRSLQDEIAVLESRRKETKENKEGFNMLDVTYGSDTKTKVIISSEDSVTAAVTDGHKELQQWMTGAGRNCYDINIQLVPVRGYGAGICTILITYRGTEEIDSSPSIVA